MSSSYESIGRALQDAAARIPAPPQSRWVPSVDRRSRAGGTFATVAVAILLIVLGAQLNALRVQRSAVGSPSTAFQMAEDAEWARIRNALPADVVVLRPTWIPAAFAEVGTSDCPTPVGTPIVSDGGYDFYYRAGKFIQNPQRGAGAPPSCAKIEIRRNFYQTSPSLTDNGSVNERGTTVRVRTGPPVVDANGKRYQLIYMNWFEYGTQFELSTLDLDLPDALRVLRGLEPMK